MITFNNMRDWTSEPTRIDTMYMVGEGYQVGVPPELEGKHSSDQDAYALKWLMANNLKVREAVTASTRGGKLLITPIDWKEGRH